MRRIVIVGFEGVVALDALGPAEVFAAARAADGGPAYRVELASIGGGRRATSTSIEVVTRPLERARVGPRDTVIVAGGEEPATLRAMRDERLLAWIRRAAPRVHRIGSVCSGSFLLAAAGVLDGRRAVTHWRGCDRLRAMFPRVSVDADAIFVRDGRVWTSAGVTTGIDMALAIVEEDLGAAAADAIAAGLVLYVRRPGFQSQFSDALSSQLAGSEPMRAAVAWIRAHLRQASVPTLARATGMSVRTLHRRCLEHLDVTPAQLVTRVRVEHARALLTSTRLPLKELADQCGFGSATHLTRACERELGLGARDYRTLHSR